MSGTGLALAPPTRRSLLELAVALGLGWGLAYLLPLAPDDPFRTSLTIVPLVVAALRAIERHALEHGGRKPADRRGEVEAVVLVLLGLLAVGRQSLGLAVTEGFVAAGFLLLLAHRVARLLPVLAGSLGRRLPKRPPAVFFFLPLVVYLAIVPWMHEHRSFDGDEPYYLLLTHSLAHDFDSDLGNNYAAEDWRAFLDRPIEPQPGDPVGLDGEVRSRHNLLLPLILAPAYRVAGAWGVLAMMAAIAAGVAWMLLRLAHRFAPDRPAEALLVYALFAFSPPMMVYCYQVWVEVPAALLVALAADRVWRLGGQRPRWSEGLLIAAVLLLLLLLKLRFGLVAIPLLLLAAWRGAGSGRRQVALLAGVFAAGLAGLMAWNYWEYGNPLKMHSWVELGVFEQPLQAFVRGGLGMFYDSSFGLFPSAPIWLLLLPAVVLLIRQRNRRLRDLLLVSLPYMVVVAPRAEWFGGWSPPFRYSLVLLPLWALTLVPLMMRRNQAGMRVLLGALGALTLLLTMIWIVMPGWTYNLATGSSHLLEGASALLEADVVRLFPSMVRPRVAAWIWPLASLLLIPLAFWRARRARRIAPLLGVTALLLAGTAVPLAARRLPTRTVEVEDDWVRKRGGNLHPTTWTLQRVHFRGGWVLSFYGQVEIPVVAGGPRALLQLELELLRPDPAPFQLHVAAGEHELTQVTLETPGWQTLDLGPFDWPAGVPLVLRGPAAGTGTANGLVLDRVTIEWR